jgi:hypothetical protein
MYLTIGLLGLALLFSFWLGYKRVLHLQLLNKQRVINGFIGLVILLTLLSAGQWLGFFSQDIGAKFTMLLYCLAGGFFCGFATQMIVLRRKIKAIEYVYRSFWTDVAPNLLSILLIAFGIYRTGFLSLGPYTGIGITSGLSLFGFGFFGLTIRVVPEFRRKGILILDQYVPWKKVVAYQWERKNALKIDYYTNNDQLTDFTTFIPPDDELTIERLLSKKLNQYK